MIDTDKYEGHTEGRFNTEISNAIYHGLIQLHPNELGKANARLAVDAPLLLAEVKRLREWKAEVERICRTMNGPNRDTALFIMTNKVEEE